MGSEKGVYPQNDMFFMRKWWYHGIPPCQWRYGWTATKIMVDAVQWSSSSLGIQELRTTFRNKFRNGFLQSGGVPTHENMPKSVVAWTWEFHSITQLSNLMVKSIPLFVFPTVFRVSARPHLPSLNLKPPSKYSLAIQWHPVIGGSIRVLCWLNPNFSSPCYPRILKKSPCQLPMISWAIHPLAPSLYLIPMSVIGYPAPIFLGEIREGMSQHFGAQKTSQDSLSVKKWGFKLFPSFSHSYPKMSPKLEFLWKIAWPVAWGINPQVSSSVFSRYIMNPLTFNQVLCVSAWPTKNIYKSHKSHKTLASTFICFLWFPRGLTLSVVVPGFSDPQSLGQSNGQSALAPLSGNLQSPLGAAAPGQPRLQVKNMGTSWGFKLHEYGK